jgi:hypothetical protein
MKQLLLLIAIIILPFLLSAQAVYEPVTNNPVYELLDELASLKIITINSAIKPYSRVFIADKLNQALLKAEKLNKRQLAEVKFFLRDYAFESGLNSTLINGQEKRVVERDKMHGEKDTALQHALPNDLPPDLPHALPHDLPPDLLHVLSYDPIAISYPGPVFKLRATPWLGGRFMVNENGNFKEFTGGGEVFGYLGKHIGYYANVKYTWESEPMVNPVMFTLEEGKSWNYLGNGSVENTEWRGGISVGWNWGEFGVFKDRPVWGNANHGSNIMSGHAPSFPYIQLHLKPAKWIEFYSITGFLKSDVIDSSRSSFEPGSQQIKYHKKYFSANFFTITPWKRLDISFGNSIFWSDVFKVAYLMPFNLYKAVDESLKGSVPYTDGVNTNDDGHLFMDISSRNIRHLQLYLSVWIDEWMTSRILKKNQHNLLSWKAGFSLYDLPVKNLSLTVEGLHTRPGTYDEYNPSNVYANDDYSFGNYLRGDAWELYICLNYKPVRGMLISTSYNLAQRGGYIYWVDDDITYPLAKNLIYNQTSVELNASYRIVNNVKAFIGYIYTQHAGDLQYIPQIFHGNTNTLSLGILAGF